MDMQDVKVLDLPKILDKRGNLSIIQEIENIPFKIKRIYWIYDVPGGERRGGHAYKKNQEFIVALSGSFDVVLDDGNCEKVFFFFCSYYGIYVPQGIWRKMQNFSTNALALVLSSTNYDPDDYILEYIDFVQSKKSSL